MSESNPAKVYEGRHLSMLKRGGWEYAARNTAQPVVGIVALTGAGDVVLVEQFRPPVDRSVIELPAGLCGDIVGNEHEALLEAAQRELLEETGYAAQKWTELVNGYSSAGLTNEAMTLFLAQGLSRAGAGGGDESEDITIHEVPLSGVLEWLRNRDASVDLKLLAGLYAASEYLRAQPSGL